jgi:hypothetical protein
MSEKTDFVRTAVRRLMRDGITKKSLESYLSAAWSYGAHTALLSPPTAVENVSPDVRRQISMLLIRSAMKDYLAGLGVSATKKAMDTIAGEMLDRDDTMPATRLVAGDWIIGLPSTN